MGESHKLMTHPGKWHITRCHPLLPAAAATAKRCLPPTTSRVTLLLTFLIAMVLPLEAKAPVALNEGNYEEEGGDDLDDDESSVKKLIRASLERPSRRGPALVPVADIPAVWTCKLELESGDAEKLKQWKRSPVYRGYQRMELSTSLKGTAENPGQWAAQRAYVVELEDGTFYQSKTGESYAMNRTFQVQTENLLNTVCSICPERHILKRSRWSPLKKPNDRQVFWTEPSSAMVGILKMSESRKKNSGKRVKGLLVFPSAMSYWAARRYQHSLMDLLPHIVPYIPFLKAHREVQVAVPSQFHSFLRTLGLHNEQLLNTAANLFRAEKLYVGLFLDTQGTVNSAQCASCCSSCWRNPGLISYFSTALETFVEAVRTGSLTGSEDERDKKEGSKAVAVAAAAADATQCKFSGQYKFERCYQTQNSDGERNAVHEKLSLVTQGRKTLDECSLLAQKGHRKYFAMETPHRYLADITELDHLGREGETAECWLSGTTKHIGILDRHLVPAGSTRECLVQGRDSCGRHLGGNARMALYAATFSYNNQTMSSRPAVVYAARPNCALMKCRSVLNHDEVVARITSTVARWRPRMEVVVFNPFKYQHQASFEYQVQLFRRAKVLVGAHGGALTNLMLMQPGCQQSSVIEFVGDQVSDVYAETHPKLSPSLYKSLHYAYYGSMVDYSLGVYDKVLNPVGANKTTIPLNDLEVALATKLRRLEFAPL